ncbi:DEAD/DEAH box helicase [Crocinitomicaceae bacterium CZZ-1]|uniref:DEAD/DEAH box helicase n=1 Tax=Taishania pollutisoli TaxID=2766479 RepID=A0A8J6P776_9FLAO|nr:DEAD/DEAH box helicase [Taishania pollutisoli]MBC9813127.1 DEAD/DEAH box helicase [Taishania pollutisoli]MBX2950407.1 DEAD/DEAH box helicase [Crocinitomicaceae bacterium]NGF76367.1 DEAD/DEAH box helicase [Fluviicola sp. SGL-29]
MSFKKLKPEVVEALKTIPIESLVDAAKSLFSTIKSGKNVLISAPVSSGKTTTALVSIFNKVNQEYEGSPRAILLTNSIEKAEALHKKIAPVCRKLDVTADLIHDKGNSIQQRNDIFDGTEIIIGNPKRIFELYLQNGINLKLLDLFIVDDLDECLSNHKQAELKRLIESLESKTQLVLLTNVYNKKVEVFIESLEIPLAVVELDESI